MTDLELLRRHEPVLRCTQGEGFFPTDAEAYIAECDLWAGRSPRDLELVLPYGELTPALLAELEPPVGQRLFLRFVQEPSTGTELARQRGERPRFESAGRLARVGLFARLLDAAFNVSLLVRGTVPGGTTAGAWAKYRRMVEADARVVYHGRVVRRDGWIVLQYLLFYVMNDWRTTFGGANDHEADWEQVSVYLEDAPGGPRPVWCAAAAHEAQGDDLRRRWDDPELERVGDHPVLYVGAGSHATYFESGEYITTAPLPGFRPLRGFLEALRVLWRDVLRQEDPGDLTARLESWLTVPFIDYARGDGASVGPGQPVEWSPVLVDDRVPWVSGYRGLFGLDTYDRLAGERAPGGPKFRRDGTVRQSWHDPLGWAGLAKVAPPYRSRTVLEARLAGLEAEQERLRAEERERARLLPALGLELGGLRHGVAPPALGERAAADVRAGERELAELRRELAFVGDRVEAVERELERLARGDFGDPREHIRHPHRPVPPEVRRYGVLVEAWSALGVGALLLAIVGVTFFTDVRAWVTVLMALGLYVVLESAFRRRLVRLLLWTTLGLAAVAGALLAWEFLAELVIVAVVGVALLTLVDNVRELRRR